MAENAEETRSNAEQARLLASRGETTAQQAAMQSAVTNESVAASMDVIQSLSQLTSILDKLNRLPDVIEARREQSGLAHSA